MVQTLWVPEDRKHTICVDSYDGGILQGRFFGAFSDAEYFQSLSQFLVKMDELLEQCQSPKSDTSHRSFSQLLMMEASSPADNRKGSLATFELQILFRQHSSWQGTLIWKERHRKQSFRSVLELILLMDSALRDLETVRAC